MNQNKDRSDLIQDGRLAEFADQIAEGKINQTESNADDELLSLEKTILRLNQSLPPVSVDDATVKQMQVRLNARIRREVQDASQPFWKKWFSSQSRPQIGIAFAAALVILLLVFAPLFTTGGSSPATALTSMNGFVVTGILVGGILVIFWIMRRK